MCRLNLLTALLCCALIGGGCATAPIGEAPARLERDQFAEWVQEVNAVARTAVEQSQQKPTVERVRSVFDAVADSVDDAPGEAAWIVNQWRERSGNLGTLFDYFLSRNYLLNYYFFDRGSDFLVALEPDRYGLTLAVDSLDALFDADGEYVAPWIVDSADFVFGTSYGVTPVVNRARAHQLHDWIREHLATTTRYSGRVDFGAVMQVVAANEVAHATLVQRYGYGVDSTVELASLGPRLPGLPVQNARQVHEFVSDAASLGTDRIAIFALTANLLQLASVSRDGTLTPGDRQAYTPGASFFVQSVQEIMNRRGRNIDLAKMIATQASKGRSLRRYATGQLSVQILEALGDEGYRDLMNDYRRYARILIDHVAKAGSS